MATPRRVEADPLESYLARIATRESEIHAFAWFDPDWARRRAAEIEATVAADAPLRGVPIGIKDVIDVAGMPTGMGSPLFAGRIAAESADLVRALERAGALLLGKTVTAELAFFAPGATRNPHNLAHTPGGSSSGSAAAVAAGFVPVAIGTQTNGSTIRPAAFCGIVGLKPTRGSISTRGMLSWSPTLDQPGIFGRTVADCAQVNSVLRTGSVRSRLLPSHDGGEARPTPPRLAAIRSPVWPLASDAQQLAFGSDGDALRRAGAHVVDVELPPLFTRAHATHFTIMAYEGARYFRDLQARHRAEISGQLNRLIDDGAEVSDAEYREALALRDEMLRQLAETMKPFDAILTPPATGEAPASLERTGDPTFCTIWTLCGVPAITIPTARGTLGLPLGLQIVGGDGDDDELLQTARWCEARLTRA